MSLAYSCRVGLELLRVGGDRGVAGRAHPAAQPADDRRRLVRAEVDAAPRRGSGRGARANPRPSRPPGIVPPTASRSRRTPPIESRSAVASTSDGEIERGIDGNSAVAGFSMTTAPPACFTCQAPADPSLPVPVRITAVRPGPNAVAAVSSRRSTEGATLPGRAGRRRSSPPSISTSRFDGTTKMTPSSSAADSSTTLIGRAEWRAEDLAEVARSARVQVLGDDDRGREVRRQAGDDARQRLDPARGGTDDDELRFGRRMLPHRTAF